MDYKYNCKEKKSKKRDYVPFHLFMSPQNDIITLFTGLNWRSTSLLSKFHLKSINVYVYLLVISINIR